VGVRAAVAADDPWLATLLQEAAEGLVERRGGQALSRLWLGPSAPSAAADALRTALAGIEHQAFVDDDGTAAAWAWVADGVGSFCCYVAAAERRQGRGPALGAAALAWLEPRCATIDVLALPGDRDWKSLLEKAGFKARLLTLSRGA
jgi:GNAT superfamily N-acetyltransferase